jgi:hypothetical protein
MAPTHSSIVAGVDQAFVELTRNLVTKAIMVEKETRASCPVTFHIVGCGIMRLWYRYYTCALLRFGWCVSAGPASHLFFFWKLITSLLVSGTTVVGSEEGNSIASAAPTIFSREGRAHFLRGIRTPHHLIIWATRCENILMPTQPTPCKQRPFMNSHTAEVTTLAMPNFLYS